MRQTRSGNEYSPFVGCSVTSNTSTFDFETLLQATLDELEPEQDDTEGQELDYVTLAPEDSYRSIPSTQFNSPSTSSFSSPLSSTASLPSHSPFPSCPGSPASSSMSISSHQDPISSTAEPTTPTPIPASAPTAQRTKTQLKRFEKSKTKRAAK